MERTSEIRALVSLLADDDVRIGSMVWENLLRLGAEALPVLREACEAPDPRLRARARHTLDRLAFEQIQADLRALCAAPEEAFDVEGALHALGRMEDPDLPRGLAAGRLDALAREAGPRAAVAPTALDRVTAVNEVLFGEERFSAPLRSQVAFRHFCLHRVLELRAGAPALLASTYLLLGDRVGLPLSVVWLPTHDLLRLEADGGEWYIDPARGGRVLSRRECIHTCLRDYHPKDSYIKEVGRRDLVIRAARGMMLFCARTKDRVRSERLDRLLEILQTRERAR